MAKSGIKNVFGGGGFGRTPDFSTPEGISKLFDILLKGDCKTIDTAALYGPSEKTLGENKAGDKFTLDTKFKGGFGGPGYATKSKIEEEAGQSKTDLGYDVDIYYIHAPDNDTDYAETLAGIDAVHKKGFFKRFGLSNYQAKDVQRVYDICKEKGYVLPTVYQGNYSAVARKQEEVLFPTLRKLGISFYAYSPIAGGFLTKTKQDVLDGKGRFDKNTDLGKMYSNLYSRPSYLEALEKWEKIAKDEGIPRAELAYRWVKYNSSLNTEHGDAIIFGASSLQQAEQTLEGMAKGPLSEKAVKAIDDVWAGIKHEAPLDNFHF